MDITAQFYQLTKQPPILKPVWLPKPSIRPAHDLCLRISELRTFLQFISPFYLGFASLSSNHHLSKEHRFYSLAQTIVNRGFMSEDEKTLLDTQFKAQIQHIFSQMSIMEENMAEKTEHATAIQWYLKKQLMSVSEELQHLQTKRLEKTKKSIRPILSATTHSRLDFASELTSDQKQILAKENEFLLATLETSEDQVQQVTQSILVISELQKQMAEQLNVQQSRIDTLHSEAIQSKVNMNLAKSELVKSKKYFESRQWIAYFLFLMSGLILTLDWYWK